MGYGGAQDDMDLAFEEFHQRIGKELLAVYDAHQSAPAYGQQQVGLVVDVALTMWSDQKNKKDFALCLRAARKQVGE